MTEARHLSTEELEAGLDHILDSPQDGGELRLIVARPSVDERQPLQSGELDT